jgi:hypothetical protein
MDLYDAPPEVREDLRFVFLDRVDQALEEALHPAGATTARRRPGDDRARPSAHRRQRRGRSGG